MVYAQCCLLRVNARIFFDFLPGAMVEMSGIEALKIGNRILNVF